MIARPSRIRVVEIIAGAALAAVVIAAAFLYPFSSDAGRVEAAIATCESDAAKKQQCFEALIVDEARARGLSSAFDVLGILYERDREFAAYCHGNTHQLGEMAYELFKEKKDFGLSTKTSYCGFGFFHGFLETLLFDSGDLSEARRFCEYVDAKLGSPVEGFSTACYHGIGHGVIDGSDPARWGNDELFIGPGLALCGRLSDVEEHKKLCASGVFNALAIAYRDPKYRLPISATDPYAICRKQDKIFNREMCYDQMNSYLLETEKEFGKSLLRAEASAEKEYRAVAVSGVASYRAQSALAESSDLSLIVRECDTLSANETRDACAQGLGAGFIEFGKPDEEYTAAVAACAGSGARSASCFRGVVFAVMDRLPRDRRDQLCVSISAVAGEERAAECEDIIRGPQ